MALTNTQMLEEIRLGIEGIVKGGQSITIFGSRQVTRANLDELFKLEKLYQQRVLAESGSSHWLNTADFGG